MKIQDYSIEKLIPYEFNNKKHNQKQVNRVANSIKEFGFNQPIVIDENNIILVGHARHLASLKLGLKEVPVLIKTDLSEIKKKAYRILDNKLSDDSDWDFDNLNLELDFLEDNDFDINEWGLDELRIDGETEEVAEDDFQAPESVETFIKLGDLIELGKHRVLCGDSTNTSSIDKLMGGGVADMVFTDPPYGVNYEGGHFHSRDVNIKRKTDKLQNDTSKTMYQEFLRAWINRCKGAFYVFHANSCPYDLYKAVEENNCEIHALIIWHKINAKYAAMNAHYKQRHEPCLYFKKKGNKLYWVGPSDECTVWEEKRDPRNDLHPTQKPICLSFRAIKNHDAKIIGDPFLGSGSTLIACEQLNRICYGMELEPKYCEIIIKRFFKHCKENNKVFDCKINGEPYKPIEE